ncbi:Transcription factor BIM1, putative isoform 2 [Hibiscus syriacus]|uniref:Transcription factor BIM1, putative isoform 2 n=1 Tax=Hibiscus syriacus TaxID=106335 RepID=A0A6A2X0R7_HIBSY|nr:Transcription factor BIM1, putative isoform 2 [Hibiscus syriacus]
MELPRSWPLEAEGRKSTHDFLSLYSHSNVQQDPRPPSQGGYLKTHDFLQLERLGKATAKEETPVEEAMAEKPPAPAPAPPAPPPRSVEHILPGGIGTYSISHISYKTEGPLFTTVAQRSSSERNDETSNCSSYTGSGFTLWEESAATKRKTGNENTGKTPAVREAARKEPQWATSSLERASQSSTNNYHNSFSSLSSSRPSSKQKSFMAMITSAKGSAQYDDFEEDEDFILKKQSSTTTQKLRVKVDGKSAADQKANTPRSKHSATEQRRRSKINDRQMLRGIMPNSDQKRDKASFLLEVIEYIQFLQEKVHKYEGAYQGWNHEPSKSVPWSNNERPSEDHADQTQAINGMSTPALAFSVAPNIPGAATNPVESDVNTATTLRPIDLGPVMMNKAMPFLVSPQPNLITSPQSTSRLLSDAETNGPLPIKKPKVQELTVEGGTISISNVYSQGLPSTLTQALQTSGVDLSHASISVQIDLGKQSSINSTAPKSTLKSSRETPTNQGTAHSRVGFIEDSDRLIKKLKT